jgi:hypothetical protein
MPVICSGSGLSHAHFSSAAAFDAEPKHALFDKDYDESGSINCKPMQLRARSNGWIEDSSAVGD